MTNPILIKRSSVPGKVPATTDLALGELGINTYDGKAYLKRDNGTQSIVQITRAITLSTSTPSGGVDGDIWLQYTP